MKKIVSGFFMMIVFICALSCTASAAEYRNIYLVGDSRTVYLRDWTTHPGNVQFCCRGAMGYYWMVGTQVPGEGVPTIEGKLGNGDAVIFLMGTNDVHYRPGVYGNIDICKSYANYINTKADVWGKKGVDVYFATTGPTIDSKVPDSYGQYVNMTTIRAFNRDMKKLLSKKVEVIDQFDFLVKNGFDSLDGVHYDQSTCKRIMTFLLDSLKNNKLMDAVQKDSVEISSILNRTNGVQLKWNAVDYCQGYYVYRRRPGANNAYTRIATVQGNNVTTYLDRTAEEGKSYFYVVRGFRKDYKNTYRTRYTSYYFYRLTTPTALSAKSYEAGYMAAAWKRCAAATGYEILYYKDNTFVKKTRIKDNQTLYVVDKGLENNTEYTMKFRTYKIIRNKYFYSAYKTIQRRVAKAPLAITLNTSKLPDNPVRGRRYRIAVKYPNKYIDRNQKVVWTSSDPEIVSITEDQHSQILNMHQAGTVTITAVRGRSRASIRITVTEPEVTTK